MTTAKIPVRTLQIKVKPNARASTLEAPADDGLLWLAQLKSPPVDGKANEELIALVAGHFGCRKSAVTIRSGASGRLKMVRIDDPKLSAKSQAHAIGANIDAPSIGGL